MSPIVRAISIAEDGLHVVVVEKRLDQVALANNAKGFEIVEAQLQAGVTYYIAVLATSTVGDAFYKLSIDVN